MEYAWKDDRSAPALTPGATILACFPSAGLATTVAGHYIVQTLRLGRIGRFVAPEAPPIAVIQGGRVHPPIRVYGRPDFAVVLSEFPPTSPQAVAIARTLLAEAAARRAKWLISLEGVSLRGEGDEGSEGEEEQPEPKVYSIVSPSEGDAAKAFAKGGAEPLDDGVLGGLSGALLVQSI
ncbi:MAG: PAC2 family protein, partial [Thermoplasmata archaeon]